MLEPVGKKSTVELDRAVLEEARGEAVRSRVQTAPSGEWELVAQIDQLMRQADQLMRSGDQAQVVLACRLRSRAHALCALLARVRLLRALAASASGF